MTVYLYSQRLNSTRVSGLNRALSQTHKGPNHNWALTVGLWGLTHGGTMRSLNLSLFLSPPHWSPGTNKFVIDRLSWVSKDSLLLLRVSSKFYWTLNNTKYDMSKDINMIKYLNWAVRFLKVRTCSQRTELVCSYCVIFHSSQSTTRRKIKVG